MSKKTDRRSQSSHWSDQSIDERAYVTLAIQKQGVPDGDEKGEDQLNPAPLTKK
jgi:hypothetical protein